MCGQSWGGEPDEGLHSALRSKRNRLMRRTKGYTKSVEMLWCIPWRWSAAGRRQNPISADINNTTDCLETLPGIGSVRAESIVAHREQAGPFATAAGIVAVPGIGDGIYRRIANLITVTPR